MPSGKKLCNSSESKGPKEPGAAKGRPWEEREGEEAIVDSEAPCGDGGAAVVADADDAVESVEEGETFEEVAIVPSAGAPEASGAVAVDTPAVVAEPDERVLHSDEKLPRLLSGTALIEAI